MRIKTTVGQVAVVGGRRDDQASGILIDERSSRLGRDRGSLYVLVEVSGQEAGRDTLARRLAGVIGDAYHSRRGSLTASLQQAIRQANTFLYKVNRDTLPGERRTAGVSCVVLRTSSHVVPRRSSSPERVRQRRGSDVGAEDLFVAQAGPAAVFLAHEGQVTRFPDVSPWLDDLPPEEMDIAPLGKRHDVSVALFHARVTSGDTVVLVDSQLARRVHPHLWPSILARGPIEQGLDALQAAGKGGDLSALLLVLGEERVSPPSPHPTAPDGASKTPPPAPAPVRERISRRFEQLRVGEALQALRRMLVALLASLWAALLTLLKRLAPSPSGPQQIQGRRDTLVKKRKKGAKIDRAQSNLVQQLLVGVAIAIPIVVAAIVLVIFLQRGQAHKAELEALWQQASTRWEQAQATSDQATVRTLLTEAEGFLDQLIERRPDRADAVELRKKIEARLDEINQVRRISWVAALKSYPADANLTRVVVEGVHIFVLDRRGGKVYHHQLDELQQALLPDTRDTVLVSRGEQVGNVLVSDLVDMVWMPVGSGRQKASLVILESGGALLDYDPATGEMLPLRVADSETWKFPELVGSYYGRFYLLDPAANKIWRYAPTMDGYSSPPDDWLQTEVDLVGVVDMAIGDSIYLLYADGQIRKLTGGRPDTYDISDWDTAPRSPTAIFTRPPEDTRWIYVADPGNNRIVQCSKEGLFKRQFRMADPQATEGGNALAGVTSLFVDEKGFKGTHAYFLSGEKLYMMILPDD